jgi:hypothetical protein
MTTLQFGGAEQSELDTLVFSCTLTFSGGFVPLVLTSGDEMLRRRFKSAVEDYSTVKFAFTSLEFEN